MPEALQTANDAERIVPDTSGGNVSLPAWRLEAFSSLVGEIYEAAASADSFEPVLRDIATLIEADVAALCCWDKAGASSELIDICVTPAVNGVATDWIADFVNCNRPLPYCGGVTGSLVFSDESDPGALSANDPVVPPDDLAHWESALAWVFEDSRLALAIVVARQTSRGSFSGLDKRIFSELRPHLRRGMSLCRLAQNNEWNNAAGLEALNHLHTGVIMVDHDGHVYFANLAAERLCRTGQGLRLSHRGIYATRMAANEELQSAIRKAHSDAESGSEVSINAVAIPRGAGQSPIVLSCLSVPGKPQLFLASQPRVILLLRDPDAHLDIDDSVLEILYGLTHCETQVALGIADGHSITQLAQHLHATDTTVRNTLKRVFQKTHVHSQSELAALVAKTLLP